MSTKLELDGMDLSNLLLNGEALAERPLFWRYRNKKAVRSGNFKLLVTEEETYLFDLKHDVGEQHNIATQNKALVADLSSKLGQWEIEMGSDQEMITK